MSGDDQSGSGLAGCLCSKASIVTYKLGICEFRYAIGDVGTWGHIRHVRIYTLYALSVAPVLR